MVAVANRPLRCRPAYARAAGYPVAKADAATGGNVVNQTAFAYDGWGNVATSWQSHSGAAVTSGQNESPHVHYVYDDAEPDPQTPANHAAPYVRLKAVQYPDDGRTVYYNYPTSGVGAALSRLDNIAADDDGTTQYAAYTYLGAGTIVKVEHPEVDGGLTLSYGSCGTYAGWDRFGRVVNQQWTDAAGTTTVDRYQYTYDRNSNRLTRTNPLQTCLSETYSYDGLDRLSCTQRGGSAFQSWGLDSLGNWGTFTDQGDEQTREHNAANETGTISGDLDWIDPTYDDAGNMITCPKPGAETERLHLTYDGWNRLVKVQADDGYGAAGDLVAEVVIEDEGIGIPAEKLRNIPILMLTAVNTKFPLGFGPSDVDDHWLPIDDFVEKPVDLNVLRKRVAALLEPVA